MVAASLRHFSELRHPSFKAVTGRPHETLYVANTPILVLAACNMGAAQSIPNPGEATGVPGSYPGTAATTSTPQLTRGTPTQAPTTATITSGPSPLSSALSSRHSNTPATTPNIFVSALSYFLPVVPADLTHSHESPHPTAIRLVSLYLSRLIPPELVPRILDHAEQWTVCTREMKRFVKISAGALPPRARFGPGAQWDNGQEEDDGVAQAIAMGEEGGLRDSDGECWILISEQVGCVEKRHKEKIKAGIELAKLEFERLAEEEKKDVSADEKSESSDEDDESWEKVKRENSEGVLSEIESEEAEEMEAKGWLRKVKIHTLSRDQGWSNSGHQHYGELHESRHIRS